MKLVTTSRPVILVLVLILCNRSTTVSDLCSVLFFVYISEEEDSGYYTESWQ